MYRIIPHVSVYSLFLFLFSFSFYLHFKSYPLPGPPSLSFSPQPLPHLRGYTSTYPPTLTSPYQHPSSLVEKFLQNKAHPLPLRTYKAVLCCICAQSHRPAHVCSLIFGLIWEFRGFLVSCHCCSSYGFAIRLSSFSLCSKSSIRFPELSPIVSYKYLHLSQAAALRTSQRRAMPGSCLQAQYGISNSVRVWC